ncbi:UNVERIFIED_CONTAM: hypothetical protein Scaly_2678500 [Sesamum calycinum]|uniref:Endonuclease/exonuclease/phosphatase domain-containing protein n=1 Tax=Sesamum calycinum TaxID=2727403 RepID=A0AAW2J8H1_9LAMI
MWEKFLELGRPLNMPWIILGDFNCIKSPAEKQLGVTPTWYELKDFVDCCLALGLHDAQTTGCYYTWYSNSDSNPVWCKLDRVLLNNDWLESWGMFLGALASSSLRAKVEASRAADNSLHTQAHTTPTVLLPQIPNQFCPESSFLRGCVGACLLSFAFCGA